MMRKPRSRGIACPIPTLLIRCNPLHASLAIHIAVVYDCRTARLEKRHGATVPTHSLVA